MYCFQKTILKNSTSKLTIQNPTSTFPNNGHKNEELRDRRPNNHEQIFSGCYQATLKFER